MEAPHIVPEPIQQKNRTTRPPLANALLIAGVILLGGFMAYNFIGTRLTQLAGSTYSPLVVTPTNVPTPTITLTPTPFR